MAVTQRCRRCRKPMRNDGTTEQPIWVCNNPKCVCYVKPPEPEPTPEPEPEQTEATTDETAE